MLFPGYQFVYQPAMSYFDPEKPFERVEEGVAIFSVHPIVSTQYLLLPRDPMDSQDDHQRVVLQAKIQVMGPTIQSCTLGWMGNAGAHCVCSARLPVSLTSFMDRWTAGGWSMSSSPTCPLATMRAFEPSRRSLSL